MTKAFKLYVALIFVGVIVNCTLRLNAKSTHVSNNEHNNHNNNHKIVRRNIYLQNTTNNTTNFASTTSCLFDLDCEHGECKQIKSRANPNGTFQCVCDKGYVKYGTSICNYKQRKQLAAFLLSIFLGWFGADWFYIGDKDPTYDGLGVLKLFTVGGAGIWWLADFIRIAADSCNFKDSNNVCLESW